MTEQSKPWYVQEDGDAFRLAEMAAHAALVHKGENILVMDLRGRSDVADFFVLVTGLADVQVEAIGRGVRDELAGAGQKPMHTEGQEGLKWILIDYVDVVVHVMQERVRDYYSLEQLWNDAGRLEVAQDYFERPEVAARHPELHLVRLGAAGDREHGAKEGS